MAKPITIKTGIQYEGTVTKRDGTATRPQSATWVGPMKVGSKQDRLNEIALAEGYMLYGIGYYSLQAGEDRPHALDVTCCAVAAIQMCEFTGTPNAPAGYGYGLNMNWVSGASVYDCSAMNCRNGLVLAGCSCVEVARFSTAQCEMAAISVRNGSQNVYIHDCEQLNDVVVGNTQWPDPPRYVQIERCCATKIEVQGACQGITITDCEIRGPIHLCQIINADGSIDAPNVAIKDTKNHGIRYYTLDQWGEVVMYRQWAGIVSVDGHIFTPLEAQ